ncbi:MAG: ATP-binding protein, partial [Planctomycetes bacterium]|nr:ATP-binding protein [Planctomycetota bacterium]
MADNAFPHTYSAVREELVRRLSAAPNYLVQLVAGPRQVGKTTLLLELERHWPQRSLYVAADAPEAMLPGWWENLWARLERLSETEVALLLLDEVQYLHHWPRLLKSKVDELRRRRLPVQIVATGSSALSVGRGSRETMAGRFERLRLLHWPASEIVRCFGREPLTAAREVVQFGSYPGAVGLLADYPRWRAYARDSIVEPAIGRDLLAIEPVRKPSLLRQAFAVCMGHPAEIVSLQKVCGQLHAAGAIETVAHYLHLLEEACLVAAVPKYSGKVVRQRAAPPKLVALNNALLASASETPPPTPEQQPERWGHWVENACLALAWNCGQTVCYWREEPLEVDLVLTGSWGHWAVEIKTGRLAAKELSGVLEFCRRRPAFRPLLVCD